MASVLAETTDKARDTMESTAPPLDTMSLDWLSSLTHDQLTSMVSHVQSYIEDSQRGMFRCSLAGGANFSELHDVNQIGQDLAQVLHGAPHDVLMAKIHQLEHLHDQNTPKLHQSLLHSHPSESSSASPASPASDTQIASSAKHLLTPSPSPPIRAIKDYRKSSPFLPSSVDESMDDGNDDGWETEEEVHVSNGHVRHTSNVSTQSSEKHLTVRPSHPHGPYYSPLQVGASPNRHLLQDWGALETRNLELQRELEQVTSHSHSVHLSEQQRLRKLQCEVELLTASLHDLEAENASLRKQPTRTETANTPLTGGTESLQDSQRADTNLIHELHSKVSDLESINNVITTNREILMRRLENALSDLSNLKEQYDMLEESSRDYIQLQQAFEKQEDHIEQLQNALEEYRGAMVPYPASPVGWEKRIGLYIQEASRPTSAASLRSTRQRSGSNLTDVSLYSRPRADSSATNKSFLLHDRTPSNSTIDSSKLKTLQPPHDSRRTGRHQKRSSRSRSSHKHTSRSRSAHKHSVILASPSRTVHMPRVITPKRTLLAELENEWLRQAAQQSHVALEADDDARSTSSTMVRKAYSDVRRRFGATEHVRPGDDPLTSHSQALQTFGHQRNTSQDSDSQFILRYRGRRFPRLYDSDDDDEYWDRGRSPAPIAMQDDMFSDYEFLQADELGMDHFYGAQPRGLIARGLRYYFDWIAWTMTWVQFLTVIGIAVMIAVYRGPQEIVTHKRIKRRT